MPVTYDDYPFGFSWLPRDTLRRTSHALATDDGVWLVDPVDVPEALERAAALGDLAGVLQLPRWHEIALWWPEHRALVVAELIGTVRAFAPGGGPAGVHPLLRVAPPGALRDYPAEHLLVGHGPGVHGPAASAALAGAYARSRRDLPRLVGMLPAMARAAVATRRPR